MTNEQPMITPSECLLCKVKNAKMVGMQRELDAARAERDAALKKNQRQWDDIALREAREVCKQLEQRISHQRHALRWEAKFRSRDRLRLYAAQQQLDEAREEAERLRNENKRLLSIFQPAIEEVECPPYQLDEAPPAPAPAKVDNPAETVDKDAAEGRQSVPAKPRRNGQHGAAPDHPDHVGEHDEIPYWCRKFNCNPVEGGEANG